MWAHRENSVCLTNHPRVEFRRSTISGFWNQLLRKRSERIWNHNHGLESIEHVVRSPYMWWFHTMVIFWDIATVSFICQLDKMHIHLGISTEELPKSWPLGMSVELFLDFFKLLWEGPSHYRWYYSWLCSSGLCEQVCWAQVIKTKSISRVPSWLLLQALNLSS